jgi:ATP adenylyltransferase
MAYVTSQKETGCIFCTLPAAGARKDSLVLAVTPTVSVMLNRFPYVSGHLMVAPRAHCADLSGLTTEQFADVMGAVRYAASVLQTVLAPEGMNIGMNLGRAAGAGVADHLHWHLVPRWVGDTNFMPLIGEVRVVPEHLSTTYDRLQPHFASLDKPLG